MMKFANVEFLYLLLALPAAILLFYYSNYRRRKRLRAYGDPELLRQLMPDLSTRRPGIKFWLTTVALGLLIVALSRPQFGSKLEKVTRNGIETVIALDISNSMLAGDVAPNRLEKSKRIISRLVDTFEEDKVGLIVFAGDAFVQLPITNDFVSAKMFLDGISPSLINRQGTDIRAAIDLAAKSFTPNQEVGKAIILITDGENHEGGAVEAAQQAAEKGMTVYVLGVGSPEGAPIPLTEGGNDYRRDKEGNVVVTRLNEQMAKEIAAAGKGAYIHVDNTNSAQRALQNEIDKLAKSESESEVYVDVVEQFPWFVWIALLLLFAEMMILTRKNRVLEKFKLFGE